MNCPKFEGLKVADNYLVHYHHFGESTGQLGDCPRTDVKIAYSWLGVYFISYAVTQYCPH